MLVPSNLCCPSPRAVIVLSITFKAVVDLMVGTERGTRKWNNLPGLHRMLMVQPLEERAGPASLTLPQVQVKTKTKQKILM